ncbi:MAG: NifU family protein [Flavobacteriales bacterium]|nr:NifU family protein [Flavobacteriales bacterium]
METKNTPHTIYAEMTPNPATMKFVSDQMLVPAHLLFEYSNAAEAKESPLAQQLFSFPFVIGVFIRTNYVTITKNDSIEWNEITLELRDFISNYLNKGGKVVLEKAKNKETLTKEKKPTATTTKPFTDVEKQIMAVLEEYVRPAVEGDGGAIEFERFENGVVSVVLRGACSGCPSSTMTLKAGIEGLLTRMVPEVKEVVAING